MNSKSEWVNSIPCINTSHVPSAEALQALEKDEMVAAYAYGAFVFIGDKGDGLAENLPEWMHPICEWAWEAHGYDTSWIRLDADGDNIDDLPSFDW